MVTFVCEYCDLTLKKKQCDGHVLGRCRPGSLICIDCSVTFKGNDYKNHISCISEADKHWGQYAPSKQQKGHNNSKNTNNPNEKQQNKNTKVVKQKKEQVENWLGWKNEINAVLNEKKNIKLQQLKIKVLKRYHQQFQISDKDQEMFMYKLQKLKKVKLTTYVQLDQ